MNSQLAHRHRPIAKGWGSKTEAEILQIVQELRQAREFQAIAARYVPKGCRMIYCRDHPVIYGKAHTSLDGAYVPRTPTLMRHLTRPGGVIHAPRPTTIDSLHIFLHECGHVHCGHYDSRIRGGVCRLPEYLKEMQAEQWALATMRKHGIKVPRHVINDMREYVANKIVKAERRGATVDPEACAFAGKGALKKERNKYRGRKPLLLKPRQGGRKQTRQQSRSACG
jgi:hypothetical protein